MKIKIGTPGDVLNSGKPGHTVRIQDDRDNTGGFLVLERWQGSAGPNPEGAFDSWVESEADLQRFFAEAGYEIAWPAPNPSSQRTASGGR